MGTRLQLLGVPKVDIAGKLSDLPLDKPASLLVYLARRSDWVSRSELAFLYRPDAPESVALSNVRVLLFRAKERPWARSLEIERFRVRYRVETDVKAFLVALEQHDWSRALDLYGGAFLSGLDIRDVSGFETWLELERQELGRRWRVAALKRARSLEEQRDYAGAAGLVERVLHIDALDEEALQLYLRVLVLAGKRARATTAYDEFRVVLARELQLEPLEATRALVASLSRREPEAAGSAVGGQEARHNLPTRTTRFVGREHELQRLLETLANPDCRLMTLVGLGGVGKTRLALQVASQQLPRYRDGVWFVDLAGLASPTLLVASIASSVGLGLSDAADPGEQLLSFLHEKELLLLLDNFEHLVEGASLLELLLAGSPGLDILVTSRVALELKVEWLVDVEGLSYPPVDTREPLESYDAVVLFIRRAERVSATFVPQGRTLEAVAALTRRVEGLPLALELAATWTRSLSVPELLDRLDACGDVLEGRLRDLPERHRSVRRVFDYSWQRLSSQEQQVLTGLSLFRGGFTHEAAERVAGAHLALLLSLINHSLIQRMAGSRYRVHELLRQYARSHLAEERRRELEAGFSTYYLGLVRRHAVEVRGDAPRRVVGELIAELDNLRQACTCAVAQENWRLLAEALPSLRHLFHRADLVQEGLLFFEPLVRDLEAARGGASSDAQTLTYACALLGLVSFQALTGSLDEVRTSLQRITGYLRATGPREELAHALGLEAEVACQLGDHAASERLFAESLALSRASGARHQEAATLRTWGWLERARGNFGEAAVLVERSVDVARESRDAYATARGLESLVALWRETEAVSPRHFEGMKRALRLYRQAGSRRGEADINNLLALYARDSGDYRQGEKLLQDCLALARHSGNRMDQAIVLFNLGESWLRQEQAERALAPLRQARELSESLQVSNLQVLIDVSLAEGARQQGRLTDAMAHFRTALELVGRRGIGTGVTLRALYYLAVLYATDDIDNARLLAAFVCRSRQGFFYTRQDAHRLSDTLCADLAPAAIRDLERRAATLGLEAVVAGQLERLISLQDQPRRA